MIPGPAVHPVPRSAQKRCNKVVQPVTVDKCTETGKEHTMSLSLVHSRALQGLQARPVQVEVHLANGLPSFTLVGLADTEVKEARDGQKNIPCRLRKGGRRTEKMPT